MNLNIHERLDPVFETLGLLYVSYHVETYKKGTIEDLNKFGLDGEAFYSKHLKIVDKYIHTFLKYRVLDKDADFFSGMKMTPSSPFSICCSVKIRLG